MRQENEAPRAVTETACLLLGAAIVGVVWLCTLAVEAAWPSLFCVGAN